MKKKIVTIFFLIVLVLLSYKIYKLFITEHNISYKINGYKIKEAFHKDLKHHYDIIIEKKDFSVTYTLNKNLKKQKKVIKKINNYKSNNVTCILPIYKKNIEKTLYCTIDGNQVSNYYLEKSNNQDYKKIISKAKVHEISKKSTKTNYKKIKVYQKNISNNEHYIIWDYKGIYILNKEKLHYQKILNEDLYDNIMATIAGKFFVIFDNRSVDGIKQVFYYDLEKEKLHSFNLDIVLSKKSYINGVIDDEIYITDLKAKKEYKIDISKKEIIEVDEDQTNYFIYENGNKKHLSKSDYFLDNQLFSNKLLTNKEITNSGELRKEYNYYYYYENNIFYKVLENNLAHPITLFKLNNISDWYIVDRGVILIKDDTLYYYDDENGLKEILISNELKYNYKNIYYLWKN